MHSDKRWRHNLRWLAWSFDYLTKKTIHVDAQRLAKVKSAVSELLNTASDILEGSQFNEGSTMPVPTALRGGNTF